jgi:hypothetical protein
MIKIKNIFSLKSWIILTSLFFISCSDEFTLLAPESQRNVDNFYQTKSDFETALNGVYDALQSGGAYGNQSDIATGGTGGYWMMTEMRSDNTDQGGDVTGLAAAVAELNEFAETSLSEYTLGVWSGSYQGVARANTLITRIQSANLDDAFKNQVIGEALFVRALFYYNLAMLFGNIPMPLEEILETNPKQTQLTKNQVLTQLVIDLTDAAGKISGTPSLIGRATKWSALTLLGRVQLHLGNKSEAASALNQVINSGSFSLLSNYADLWGPSNENSNESIFEVQFVSGGMGEGSGFTNSFSPSSDLQTGEGGGRNRPTIDMSRAYEEGDLRYKTSMDTLYVVDDDTSYARHIKKYQSNPFANFDADNNFIVFRYADVLLMAAEALGEGSQAYTYINQIRTRAGLEDISSATDGSFEDHLMHERRIELAFENHRWYDLIRFGKAVSTMNAQFSKQGFSITINDDDLVFPIPQREIDLGLTQNSGY